MERIRGTNNLAYYAVMGYPISHSLSPFIHECFAKQINKKLVYEKISVYPHVFEQAVSHFFLRGGKGLNITSPFKERAFVMTDNCTLRSQLAKSANVLTEINGQIQADNTDGIGLVNDLKSHMTILGKRILLIGAGGAVRGVIQALLNENPAELYLTNRTIEKAYALTREYQSLFVYSQQKNESEFQAFDIIINATSIRLVEEETLNLSACLVGNHTLCYDMAYGQYSFFLEWGKRNGAFLCLNGLGMLMEQAAESFYIWNQVYPDINAVFLQFK